MRIKNLPVWHHADEIIDSVVNNDITIIQGQTGSGKSTQIPQMLLEYYEKNPIKSVYKVRIAITQPRRIAAISLAHRVQREWKEYKSHLSNNSQKSLPSQTTIELNSLDAITQSCTNNIVDSGESTSKNVNSSSINTNSAEDYIGGVVGYSIRFQRKVSKYTQLLYITNGMLLREALADPMLKYYSVIIIDEVHERSLASDILLGFLKLLLFKRKYLKIIVMSATLDTTCLNDYFRRANLINIQGRQFPVRVHFLVQPCDYFPYLINTILHIHFTKKDKGGILVFLPGQDEIMSCKYALEEKKKIISSIRSQFFDWLFLISQLKNHLNSRKLWLEFLSGEWIHNGTKQENVSSDFNDWLSSLDTHHLTMLKQLHGNIIKVTSSHSEVNKNKTQLVNDLRQLTVENLSNIIVTYNVPGDKYNKGLTGKRTDSVLLDEGKDKRVDFAINDSGVKHHIIMNSNDKTSIQHDQDLLILPLFGALSDEKQESVLKPCEGDVRKVILSTNIAETSLTIPGIKYVVDAGLHKIKSFNPELGYCCLKTETISQANAKQRCGRAGREGPGEAYRLYTEEQYLAMSKTIQPEILKNDLCQTVLELKALNIHSISKFPFLTPPSPLALSKSIDILKRINAIDADENITDYGKKLSSLPLHPEHAHFLLNSIEYQCTSEILTIVAMMNTENIWLFSNKLSQNINELKTIYDQDEISPYLHDVRKKIFCTYGDHFTLLNAYSSWDNCSTSLVKFCKLYGLNHKSMLRAKCIRNQLKEILLSSSIGLKTISSCLIDLKASIATQNDHFDCIRKCILKSFYWNVAKTNSIFPEHHIAQMKTNVKHLTGIPYIIENTKSIAYIHPQSVLTKLQEKPNYIVFTELIEANKLYIRLGTTVKEEWLKEIVSWSNYTTVDKTSTNLVLSHSNHFKHKQNCNKKRYFHNDNNISKVLPGNVTDEHKKKFRNVSWLCRELNKIS